jgi:site-specific recombinase XerD
MSQPTDSDAAGKTDNVEIANLKRRVELLTRMLSEQSMDKPQQKTDIASGTSVFRVGFSPESDLDEQNRHAGPGEKRHPHPSRFSQDENENRPNRPPCRFSKGWDGLLQDWIDWSESKATRKNKRSFGNQFVAYLKQEGIGNPEDLSPKHLFAYKEQLMKNASLSTNSVHAMLCSGVKSFCTFLFQESWTRTNVGLRLKAPAYVQTPVQAMTEDDIRSLFTAANDAQRILLTFGFFLAMRVEALVSLQRKSITNIDYDKGTFVVTWTAKGDRKITKTCKYWDTALPGGARWVEKMEGWTPETYLLPGRKAMSHITSRTAERWMKRLGTKCGIQLDADGQSTITPHDLRHAGGTIVATKSNGNAYQIKAHLHHKSISTSQHYVHVDPSEVENVLATTLHSIDNAV